MAVRALDVANALTSLMQARPGYRAPTTPGTSVPVFNGPTREADEHTDPVLFIGWSSGDDAGSFSQDFGPINAVTRARDEEGQIVCTAVGNSGDNQAAADAAAFQMLTDVESLTRTNPDLGLSSSTGFRQAWGPVDARWSRPTGNGWQCRIEFTVRYRARNL